MNLAMVDLNLLVAFDALMTERHVTRAGQKIGLSQPAMSAALNRLRVLTQDRLFERRGDSMHPTPRALALVDPVASGATANSGRAESRTLRSDPCDAYLSHRPERSRCRTVSAPDQRISRRVVQYDQFRIFTRRGQRALDLVESGEADIAIGPNWNRDHDHFEACVLYQAPFACAMRADHPLASKPLTLETFAEIPQIMISQPGDPSRHIDRVLSEHGLRRRIAFTVPHYLTVPILLAKTDLLSVIPGKLIQRFGATHKIRAVETPFSELSVPVKMFWIRAAHKEPANMWLRSVIVDIVKDHKLDTWRPDESG